MRLEKISALLEADLEDVVISLKGKEKLMFWLEIQKFMHVKLSKFTEPEPEKEQINKIIFEIVDSSGKPLDDPPVPPPSTAGVTQGLNQPVQVPPAGNAPILYGAIDMGRVRSPNRFKRASSF